MFPYRPGLLSVDTHQMARCRDIVGEGLEPPPPPYEGGRPPWTTHAKYRSPESNGVLPLFRRMRGPPTPDRQMQKGNEKGRVPFGNPDPRKTRRRVSRRFQLVG